MAISDKYLQGNLNRDEMDALQKDREFTIKGIPMSVFDRLSKEEQQRILGLGSEEKTVKGIPMSIFNTLSPEEQSQILGGNLNRTEMDTIKGIPKSIFNNLSSEEQSQILGGNLNRAELNQLRESEPEVGSFSEIRDMIGRLLSSGTPTGKILEIMQSIVPGQQHRLLKIIGEMMAAGASRNEISGEYGEADIAGAPMSRFNQGGIVSLRHLTRPLGI